VLDESDDAAPGVQQAPQWGSGVQRKSEFKTGGTVLMREIRVPDKEPLPRAIKASAQSLTFHPLIDDISHNVGSSFIEPETRCIPVDQVTRPVRWQM
jgi:hypothetical protein